MRTRNPADVIDHFVAVVLNHIDREFPNKLDHVMNDASEVKSPRQLHPIFYGSFDWHSSVHGHWLLVRALRLFPSLAQKAEVITLLDGRITAENVKVETAYLSQPRRGTFERMYGWAWLLKLAAEIRIGIRASTPTVEPGTVSIDASTRAALARWDTLLRPLTDAFVDRYVKFLPKATYPIRVGTHTNTAFGLALGLDYAKVSGDRALNELICSKALAWYEKDHNYPAWEPDGSDFFSPCLMEAECMRRVMGHDRFLPWFDRFLPALAKQEPATLFIPAHVSDRTDGQITHLDGLNLSRAWCWRTIASEFDKSDPRRELLIKSYATHLEAALPHVTGDYMGEHWLATFALLAMTET